MNEITPSDSVSIRIAKAIKAEALNIAEESSLNSSKLDITEVCTPSIRPKSEGGRPPKSSSLLKSGNLLI